MKPARNGRRLLALGLLGICLGCGLSRAEESPSGSLARFIDDPQRTPANAARDVYRHPLETLLFFGLREDQTFRLREQDRARYAAIGESDRFTLRFVKP